MKLFNISEKSNGSLECSRPKNVKPLLVREALRATLHGEIR